MKHNRCHKHPTVRSGSKALGAVAAIVTLISLSACQSKQPPACEAPEVLDILKAVVIDNAKESMTGQPLKDATGQAKPASSYFYRHVTTKYSNVFDGGVNKDTKVRSCSATMQLNMPGGAAPMLLGGAILGAKIQGVELAPDGAAKVNAEYQVRLSDAGDQIHVQSTSLNSLIEIAALGHTMFTSQLTWTGQWDGAYQCQRSGEAMSLAPAIADAHESFEHTVSQFHPTGSSLEIERTTSGGGYEKLAVNLGSTVDVRVEGANTAQDRWRGTLRGKVASNVLTASGTLTDLAGLPLAHCDIHLTFKPVTEEEIADAVLRRKASQ